MNEESILGLLLRALRQAAQQEHGEEFNQGNINGSVYFGQTCENIHRAIQSLFAAERAVGYSDARKTYQKKETA